MQAAGQETNGQHWQPEVSLHNLSKTWVAASLQHAGTTCPPCWAHASSSGQQPPSCCCHSCPPSPAGPWCCQSPTGRFCDSWSSSPARSCRHIPGSKSLPAARCASPDAPLPEHMRLMARATVSFAKQAGCRCKVGCPAQPSRCSMQLMPILVASQQVVPIARGGSCQSSKIACLVCSELEAGCCAQVMKPASPGQAAPPSALLSPDLEKCGGWTTCTGWRVCILVCWSPAALSALLPLPVGLELTAGVERQLVGSQQFLQVPCTGRAAGIDSDSLLASTDLHAVTRFVMDVV